MRIDHEEIARILRNPNFSALVQAMDDQLTGKMKSPRATDDECLEARRQYHALQGLLAEMQAFSEQKE